MYWEGFLICSSACLIVSVILALVSVNKKINSRLFTPIYMLSAGVIFSSVLLYIPIFYSSYKAMGGGVFEAIFDSVFTVVDLFGFDGELGKIIPDIACLRPQVYNGYIILFSIIYVLAPVLTVGFVLSFFNSISSYVSYALNYNAEVYVFSALNEKSFELAKSLNKNSNNKKLFIIFANVSDINKNKYKKKVKELGAVYFKKEITELKLSFHSKGKGISFFAISDSEANNTSSALELMKKYKDRKNTSIYVFATGTESELLFSNNLSHKMSGVKLRRINVARSFVGRHLYEEGYEKIFRSAIDVDGSTKHISAVIVGSGEYSREMTKALPWFCQMTGYTVDVTAISPDRTAYNRLASECPELLKYSGKGTEGDAVYKLDIISGIKLDTDEFDKIISSLKYITYIFVDTGDDEENIRISTKLRTLCLRAGQTPVIQAVMSDSAKRRALTGITNYKKQNYDIDFTADRSELYSERVILGTDVEEAALARHLKWGDEDEFWRYDYNYNSSVASAIHAKMKRLCNLDGYDKPLEERTEQEKRSLRILEHRRWNAYIRSEGYIYGGTVEKTGRNDLAKLHNCLVPFDELPLEEQIKDDD